MPIPQDYLIDILEKKIDSMHSDIKENFSSMRGEIAEFKKSCAMNMECHEQRLKENEKFRWQVAAIVSGGLVALGAVFWWIDKIYSAR